jgi:hypothetical protein
MPLALVAAEGERHQGDFLSGESGGGERRRRGWLRLLRGFLAATTQHHTEGNDAPRTTYQVLDS